MGNKRIFSILVVLILLVSMAVSVFAEGGDGSGGGKNVPLGLATSSVPDGSTNVPLDVTITLTFNKNVVNFTVKDNNMACFSLTDSNGNSVPVTVLMGDDQVDPDIKRIVNIKPSSLSAGEHYTLTISGKLTAKSGATLGDDVVLHFSTVPPAATPTPTATSSPDRSAAPAGSVTASPSPSVSSSASPSPSPSEKTEKKEKAKGTAKVQEKEKQSSSLVMEDSDDDTEVAPSRPHHQPVAVYVILGLILLGVLIYFFVTRKNNKQDPQ